MHTSNCTHYELAFFDYFSWLSTKTHLSLAVFLRHLERTSRHKSGDGRRI